MDQHTAEQRYAHCSGLWAAARNRRRYNTNPSAKTRTSRRNQWKAHALTALAETLLTAVTLAAGLGMYYLAADVPYAAAVLAISISFGVDRAFRPLLDMLRSVQVKGGDHR